MAIRPDTKRYNSNTRNFCIDCTDTPKQYFSGPDLLGTDVFSIAADVWDFLIAGLRQNPAQSVNLVGHSRGGHIVVAIAGFLDRYGWLKRVPEKESPSLLELYDAEGGSMFKPADEGMGDAMASMMKLSRIEALRKKHNIPDSQCSQAVNFLGLYDAVDRSADFMTLKITGNVHLVYHAVRDPADHSRGLFGNTGRSMDEPPGCSTKIRSPQLACPYRERLFMGSHGAIGGDPGGGDIAYNTHLSMNSFVGSKRPADLQRCTTPIATSQGPTYFLTYDFYSVPIRTLHYECNVIDENIRQRELSASVNADAYIRNGARAAGLSFKSH